MRDRDTGRARGFAFVEMASDDDAQKAITELNDHQFGGRRLTVNEARPQVPRSGAAAAVASARVVPRAEASRAGNGHAGRGFAPRPLTSSRADGRAGNDLNKGGGRARLCDW